MLIKEYRCRDCGTTFESSDSDPSCPTCSGADSERAFLTPPAINSSSTRRADKIQQELASDFGMADMSNRHGEAVKKAPSGPNAPAFGGNGRIMQNLAGLGDRGDNFSAVAPIIQQAGNPKTWRKTPAVHK